MKIVLQVMSKVLMKDRERPWNVRLNLEGKDKEINTGKITKEKKISYTVTCAE